ncbi:hypothetical protein AVEN_119621-1 [Araneus ventricosus]|uniref:Uncharacterized protein n=1 Tax=Araneus ventricosus TaxID=182803 RepID=A0A4Y2PZH8_ARAVE|nr:hypothetical protein AVEN_119621-1 [Araneus ventricosus]
MAGGVSQQELGINDQFHDRIIELNYPSYFQGGIEFSALFPGFKSLRFLLVGLLEEKSVSRVMDGFLKRFTAVLVKEGGHFEPLYQ